tara:strand:+ start:207 stop:386 length:180 start_codon:yes stop_codon:yes gene_type:complete
MAKSVIPQVDRISISDPLSGNEICITAGFGTPKEVQIFVPVELIPRITKRLMQITAKVK